MQTTIQLGGWGWGWALPLTRRHARANRHLSQAMPELSSEQREIILRQMWRNFGMTFAESMEFDRLARDPSRMTMSDDTRALISSCRENPAIFASLHLGNWEAATWAALLCGVRCAGVYQKVRNPHVERMILQLRSPFYPGGLYAKGAEAVRQLIRALKRGDSVAMMADLRELGGTHVPFFGREAPSTPFPATLARSHGRRLLAAQVLRLSPGQLKIEVVEIPVPVTNSRIDDIRDATAALHRQFELWIRANPDQWMWAHRRYER